MAVDYVRHNLQNLFFEENPMTEIFAKYKSWIVTAAALVLLILAGLGVRSCSHAVKEKLCSKSTEQSQSGPDSFW